ncbi:hypothetical protein JAK28_18520 [Stenotrophomonas maltophilia]|jgi:hypothetical protein|nr:hypothetical protein [Stenotrophomonas maltophilia]
MALHEIASMRLFARPGGPDAIPDETKILNVRRLLELHGLAAKMLEAVNAHLPERVPARGHDRGSPPSSTGPAQPRMPKGREILRCTRPARATRDTST